MPARQKPAKRKPSRRQRARQHQETMRADAAAREGARRELCTVLLFWKFCGDRQCLRARGCAGNVEGCFARFWPHVPEPLKFTIRSFIKASGPGRTRQQIDAQMQSDWQRRRETEAAAARTAEASAPATSRAPLPQTPAIVRVAPRAAGPRLRVL